MESTYTVGVGGRGNHEFAFGSPDNLMAHSQQIPEELTMEDEDLDLLLHEYGAADHSSNHSAAAGAVMMEVNSVAVQGQAVPHHLVGLAGPTPTVAVGAEILLQPNTAWGWPVINSGCSQIHQEPLYSAGDIGGMQIQSGSALLMGFDSNLREVNATYHTHNPSSGATAAAAVEDIPSVVNAGLAHQQPNPYSSGDTSFCASAAVVADTGSISLHLEVNASGGSSGLHGYGMAYSKPSPPSVQPI